MITFNTFDSLLLLILFFCIGYLFGKWKGNRPIIIKKVVADIKITEDDIHRIAGLIITSAKLSKSLGEKEIEEHER